MFTDKKKYRRKIELSDIKDINKKYLEKTKQLQDILERYLKNDKGISCELDSLLRMTDNQYKKMHKQTGNNPGGIIIDCSFTDLEAVSKRMMLCKLEGDVIIRKKILLSTKKKIEWTATLLLGGTFYLYFYYSIY